MIFVVVVVALTISLLTSASTIPSQLHVHGWRAAYGAWLFSAGAATLKETGTPYPHLIKYLRLGQDFMGPGSSMLAFSAGLILGLLCEHALMA